MPLAFLTGGGSLIGEGVTRALAARGWTVAVTDVNLDLAQKVAASAGASHAEAHQLDATDRPPSTRSSKTCSPATAVSMR